MTTAKIQSRGGKTESLFNLPASEEEKRNLRGIALENLISKAMVIHIYAFNEEIRKQSEEMS